MSKQKPTESKPDAAQEPAPRRRRMTAGPCPQSANHQNTRIYKTIERKRYCVCDDCGHTWTKIGPSASDPAE